VFVIASILITVVAITAGPEGKEAAKLPPPGAAAEICIPSLAKLIDETSEGAPGKYARLPALKPTVELFDAILKEELDSLDSALSAAGVNLSASDIGKALKGPVTAAFYPGTPGERFTKYCIFIGTGNRTETIRRALVRIATGIIKSGSGEVTAGAVAIGDSIGHKWTFSEYALTLFTGYLKDGIVIANDRALIKHFQTGGKAPRRSAAKSRLFAATGAAKAGATIALDFALLDNLFKNLPAGGDSLQKLAGAIREAGVGKVVWSITFTPGGVRERIAVEGLKFPPDSKPVQTDQLKRIPGKADVIVLSTSSELLNRCGEILRLAGSKPASITPLALYAVLKSSNNAENAADVGENNSVLMNPRVRSIAAQAPLDARVFAIINLDTVASNLCSRLKKEYGDSAPEILSAAIDFDNIFGFASVAAMPARWGTLVEIRSRLAPGTPLIALTACTTFNVLHTLRERRIRMNESVAVASLRGVLVAQELYRNRHGKFSGDLAELARLRYIDTSLGSSLRGGYLFSLKTDNDGKRFTLKAEPVRPGRSGKRTFTLDETGRISEK
jgi:hypothetical protein